MEDEILTYQGGAVKSLGDGKVGGYLVRFSGEEDPDLVGDFFTKNTNFGDATKTPVWLNHRMPLGTKSGGSVVLKEQIGEAEIKADDYGVLIEAIIYNHDKYKSTLNKMGWSSGTAAHLVDRTPVGKSYRIDTWPLGFDASLTPTPAEPRNMVQPVKSIKSLIADDDLQAFIPEGANGNAPGDATADDGGEDIKSINDKGVTDMTEEVKQEAAQTAPSLDAIKAAFGETIQPLKERIEKLEKQPAVKAPAVLTMDRGDSEAHEIKAFLTGKTNQTEYDFLKASNATDMNIGTDADGGYTVPTGFYAQIIARRDQDMLANKLGVMRIPGVGTTVNVPLDGEADGEFVSTNEAAQFDLDAPAIGVKAFTLVKYTKRMLLSYELLEDTPTAIEAFLTNFVGRGLAKTHNSLLLTEVAANGTSFKTFAGASAIAFGEPEDIVGNVDLSAYLDGGAAWVGRSSTFWDIMSIVGSDRQYGQAAQAMGMGQSLIGYPFHFTDKAAAIGASAKSLYFGNWNYVGLREAPGLTMIRNPYLRADYGQLALHFHFRAVYGVLQAEAIGYGAHPTA